MTNNLGKLLLEARKEKKITQQEVAKALGISTSYVCKIENGERRKPLKEDILKKWCALLSLDYTEVLLEVGLDIKTDDCRYYDTKGNALNCDNLIKNIYSADADILKDLSNALMDENNIKIIKKILSVLNTSSIDSQKQKLIYDLLSLFE